MSIPVHLLQEFCGRLGKNFCKMYTCPKMLVGNVFRVFSIKATEKNIFLTCELSGHFVFFYCLGLSLVTCYAFSIVVINKIKVFIYFFIFFLFKSYQIIQLITWKLHICNLRIFVGFFFLIGGRKEGSQLSFPS